MLHGDLLPLGAFELTTPVMRVSDPGYSKDVWCCGTIDNCQVGTWEAAVLMSDDSEFHDYVSVLAVRAKNCRAPRFTAINRAVCNGTRKWKNTGIDVGVDSGQAGFFDEVHYQDENCVAQVADGDCKFGSLWYSYCCNLTMGNLSAGVLSYGVVSSSGFGDGSYDCIVHQGPAGKIDFAFIVFMD